MSQGSDSNSSKKLEKLVAEKTGALSPDDSVETAAERMRSVEANAWPVAEGRKLVGVMDHPDPVRLAGGRGHDPRTTRVRDTMAREVLYCFEDQDASEAQRIMSEKNLNHLTVVDREMRIVGIISRADVRDDAKGDGSAQERDGHVPAASPSGSVPQM
jgi:CBS domain-containing protein